MMRYPHWPKSVTTYMDRTIVPSGWVWLAILKLAVGPCQEVRGWLQTSCVLPPPKLEVGCDCGTCWVKLALSVVVGAPVGMVPGVPEVASGRGVLEGGSVGLAVSVGGMGVAVGTAA
jgi:hypothetical protein